MSCTRWPPDAMLPPSGKTNDFDAIDPWIADFLGKDVKTAQTLMSQRLHTDEPALVPLVIRLTEYVPYQVMFTGGNGYVRCVRRTVDRDGEAFENVYVAQPLPADDLKRRVEYFDVSIRPLMMAFLSRFAGCGEEMEGAMAGQFCFLNAPRASDLNSRGEDSYGKWRDSVRLYAAVNGDSVFVDEHGATAWHVLETDEIIPIAEAFSEFLKDYADFRATTDEFDSWTWREFCARKRGGLRLYREPD